MIFGQFKKKGLNITFHWTFFNPDDAVVWCLQNEFENMNKKLASDNFGIWWAK